MYLKRLELCGFKSFADKTRLEFEPGITAIIGPNGCGKSNTSDAIRWCLGEQSARSMRSHQMMDVVFGGSQSRPTTGMAEVSLTFDNSQNVLPIDYSEVTVTRRLFRSGESEYYINKAQCRLKDVRDLFLDTGIGAEGYSIIEQGKVEFLLAARPEERREMFEEAAGVSKYKVRREETLRKLQKVEIDMNRVNDMLSLLKEQIGSLDAAARKAKQYQKCKDDLRRIEIASIAQQNRSICEDIERIKGVLDPKGADFERLNTELSQAEADLSRIRVEQVEKDETYVKLHDEYAQVKSEINLADERIQQAMNREKELIDRQLSLCQSSDDAQAERRRREEELEKSQELARELAERVAHLEQEYREKERQIEGLRQRIGEYQSAESAARARLFELAARKTQLHNEKNNLNSRQAHCQAQVVSLRKELARLQEQRAPRQQEIQAKENELNALRQRLQELKDRQDALQHSIGEHEARRDELQRQQTAQKEKIVSLESKSFTLREWEQHDPLRATMRSVMALNIPGMRGPLSSLLHIEQGSEDLVAAALRDALDYMVCDTADVANQAIRHLEQNGGRLTFLVLERIPEEIASAGAAGENRPLTSLITTEPDLQKAAMFLCSGVSFAGQTVYGPALIQGGGTITFDQPVLIEEQLRRITEQIETTRQEFNRSSEDLAALQLSLTRALDEKRTADLERNTAEAQLEILDKQHRARCEELQYIDKEIGLNEQDIQRQMTEEQSVVAAMQQVDTSIAQADADESSVRDQQQQLERDIEGQRDEENRMTPLLMEAKVTWATQSNEMASREREEQHLRDTIENIIRQHEQDQAELLAIDTRLVELKNVQETETARLRQLHVDMQQKEVQLEVSSNERQTLTRQLDEMTAASHSLRQQVETLKTEIHDCQMEQRSFEMQLQNITVRLQQDYGMAIAELGAEYLANPVNEEEIARLKRRIESMGAVNLAAPEEYASLEERYNFLLTQQQDLFKAKEDLHQVIAKINQNTRDNFKKTFDQVREHFKTIYHQLFEGGDADIILTDESNLLECGVDIWAQPPGKKLQNIALLSGGEKALTAIALLFAFFMVRPSPFCILDEVDAPLDDANVGRYINMIKTFSERTQFLIITHSKRTMEMADILYGVTMEELGVSKIISVRLNREKEDLSVSA
jgi:chromosome segregation protein